MRGQRDLAALPKAHLHVHLAGSVRRSTVAELAQRAGLNEVGVTELLHDIASVHDMDEFLSVSQRVQSLLSTPEDVERICHEFVADEAAAGVVYSRPSFVPHDLATRLGMTPDALFTRMDAAFQNAARQFGLTVTYEIAPNRGRAMEYLVSAAHFAVRNRDRGVVAFGYGGDERWGHERMREPVEIARAGGLLIDPHAGEIVGPASIVEALEVARPDSLAHGITAAQSRPLLYRLARLRIPCHLSLSSNVKLGGVKSVAVHPLPEMLRAGMAVTLNADDTTFFAPSLLAEFELARRGLQLADAQLAILARNSLTAATMSTHQRRQALARVDEWLTTPKLTLD